MSLIWDIIFIVKASLSTFLQNNLQSLLITILVGTILAILGWLISINYHKMWNKGFQIQGWHHALCAIVAIITFSFTVIFASMTHVGVIVQSVIETWNRSILSDKDWRNKVFAKAYNEIKKLNTEDFSNYPPPSKDGTLIPISKLESQELMAKIYAESVAESFDVAHPFLSSLIWASPEEAKAQITKSSLAFFEKNKNVPYEFTEAIKIATNDIRTDLESQIEQTVWFSRLIIVLVFFILQLIPFGIISWQAYSGLKN